MMKKCQEKENNSFEAFHLGVGFQDLKELVVDEKNCILCGLCSSLCPRIELVKEQPSLQDYDPECSLCFRYCARTQFPKDIVQAKFFKDGAKNDVLLGTYRKIVIAKSTHKRILQAAQNGGIVSTLLIHALEMGYIDGVLLTDRGLDWKPKPIIAQTPEEILSAMGSKYTIAPSLVPYREAIEKYNLKKLAFVGMPCQIKAVRKLQVYPPLSEFLSSFTLIIGLYCSANFSNDLLDTFIKKKLNLSLSDITKMDISRGKFILLKNDGTSIKVPLKEILPYEWSTCKDCKDYTAEYADISVGNTGAPSDNWNSVIIRNNIGERVFNTALEEGSITIDLEADLSKIKKASSRKKLRISNFDEETLMTLRYLNLTDLQIQLYATLISLGETKKELLIDSLNIEQSIIEKNLTSLEHRGWIIRNNGIVCPESPNIILPKEIKHFRDTYEKKVQELNQKALEPLKKLFFKNNSERIDIKDLHS